MLPEGSAHHGVHVLRIRTGDDITLFNGRGGEYAARIASIERLKLLVDVLEHRFDVGAMVADEHHQQAVVAPGGDRGVAAPIHA